MRTVVTPGADGGSFTEATIAISKTRVLVKYFGTPDRRTKLKDFADQRSFTNYTIPGIDGETRAAGIPTLIQKVVFNYSLLHKFFTEECPHTEQEVFTCITEDEWILLIEIEAITEPLAKFTRSNVQSGSVVTASYFLYWKKQFIKHVESNESFKVLTRVYSIDALYGHIDALEWWKENEIKYPTLALMARVYLSRELSSCFQERVFSIAGFTGNKLRTTTDDDRAEKLALGCVNKDVHVYFRNAKKQFH